MCRSGNFRRGIEFVKHGCSGRGEMRIEIEGSVLLLQLSLSCVAVVVIARDIYPTTLQRGTCDHFHSKTKLFFPTVTAQSNVADGALGGKDIGYEKKTNVIYWFLLYIDPNASMARIIRTRWFDFRLSCCTARCGQTDLICFNAPLASFPHLFFIVVSTSFHLQCCH